MVSNQKGFTFVEMLVTFSILLVILGFIAPFLSVVYRDNGEQFNKLEWQILLQQMKMEIREAREITVSGGESVSFINVVGDVVSFEKYQDKIRRRVNSKGHELLLQHITDVTFEPRTNGFLITVVTVDGKTYQALISSLTSVEVT
ncbi:prepilin-type N-terminal cleavage/methylation domain-containing protein [Bacillus timonensis]|uniref:Prepilin-type N-terminal cleavage/methylation domain-containing protein n=1 Tax=Bacillus timonensis TaxID=1033734 RepID=A0A4S3PZU7_9BACI|nr:competence type IV pilus minor pilin ComGF [Bacillus timonensis]THE15510.1 prepilin-type N-terminal cleavage/methylation domain-containing protein [Bacillus timonensis]